MLERMCLACVMIGFVLSSARAQDKTPWVASWVATWASAQQLPLDGKPEVLENQTLRQMVRISRGGSALRVRFSNALGTTPLQLNAASVGVRAKASDVAEGTLQPLRFGGAASIEIAAGAVVWSDPVALRVDDSAELAISMYFATLAAATTQHTLALKTSYVSARGDFTAEEHFSPARSIGAWYWLSGVDVQRPGAKAIVAFGDSITDGVGSAIDADTRYPDVLARRLMAKAEELTVVNLGIGGNRITMDEIGPSAQARFDRDLLAQSGVAFALLLEGINDLGMPKAAGSLPARVPMRTVSAEQVIAGYRQLAQRAHAANIVMYAGTLTPVAGSPYFDAINERKRQAINAWLRQSCDFDGLIDFDAVTRDPAAPTRFAPQFDSGDHLHPNDAGYKAMADAIDLRLFHARGPRSPAACQKSRAGKR